MCRTVLASLSLTQKELEGEDLVMWGRVHPAVMGGQYLLFICTEMWAKTGRFLHGYPTQVRLSRSLDRFLFVSLKMGHFQVAEGGSIQRANQQQSICFIARTMTVGALSTGKSIAKDLMKNNYGCDL